MTEAEMRALTERLPTKSARIRALDKAGVSKTKIGEFLGIRYQHVYNVLARDNSKLRPPSNVEVDRGEAAFLAKVIVGSRGEVTLPTSALESLGAVPGDELFLRIGPGGLRLMTRASAIEQVQAAVLSRLPEEAAMVAALLGGSEDKT
jgi:hypothetical protein